MHLSKCRQPCVLRDRNTTGDYTVTQKLPWPFHGHPAEGKRISDGAKLGALGTTSLGRRLGGCSAEVEPELHTSIPATAGITFRSKGCGAPPSSLRAGARVPHVT